jgi:hypothetical protein
MWRALASALLACSLCPVAVAGCCGVCDKPGAGSKGDKSGQTSALSGPAPTTADGWIARANAVEGCQGLPGERYGVSMQARTAYDSGGMVDMMSGKDVRARRWESYRCAGQKVGLFVYEHKDEASAASTFGILKGFIWGGSGPSLHHPERILQRGKCVLVISSNSPSPIDRAL